MVRRTKREIPLDSRLRDTERWPTSVSWPAPVDQRLDALREIAIEEGESTALSRSELLAALVTDAPAEGTALRRILERYRLAEVRDVVLGGSESDVVVLSERRPGRRR